MQFSLRSVFGMVSTLAIALALSKWVGFALMGFALGASISTFAVCRFRTAGFLFGLGIAWLCASSGMHLQWTIEPAEVKTYTTPAEQIFAIWMGGLLLSFTYLAPIYLGLAIRDFYRARSRMGGK